MERSVAKIGTAAEEEEKETRRRPPAGVDVLLLMW